MRHRVHSRTLGRQTGHRLAMLRNLATALLEHKRIRTTETRARELAGFVERIIERAKKAQHLAATRAESGDKAAQSHMDGEMLAHKRAILSLVNSRRDPENKHGTRQRYPRTASRDRTVANQLFNQVATRYLEGPGKVERKGGYTRITRLGNDTGSAACRKGDGAVLVLVELV